MHFHIGSQVANVCDIQKALSEAARYYAELRALGAPIQALDIAVYALITTERPHVLPV